MTLDLVTNAKTQFLVTKSNASRTDPELVALDGVTNAKPNILSLNRDHFGVDGRTDARAGARTHIDFFNGSTQ